MSGVVGDTIVFVRKDSEVFTSRLDELVGDVTDVELWSNDKFCALTSLVSTSDKEKMVRVHTCSGVIDCTSNYPLLKRAKMAVSSIEHMKPDVTKLAHHSIDLLIKAFCTLPDEIDCPDAFALGAFISFGFCCPLSEESGADWVIEHENEEFLCEVKKCLKFLTVVHSPLPGSKRCQLKLLTDERPIVANFREMLYNKHGEMRVPKCIMNASQQVVERFWNGLMPFGRLITSFAKSHGTYPARGKQLAADIWILAHRVGLHVVLYETLTSEIPNLTKFELHCLWLKSRYDPDQLRYIYEIPNEQTLYRITLKKVERVSIGPGNLLIPTN